MNTHKLLILVCCLSIFSLLMSCSPSTQLPASTAPETNSVESPAATAAPTETQTPQKVIRLHFPNYQVARILDRQVEAVMNGDQQFDLSAVNPQVHVEVSNSHLSLHYNCEPFYAYIEVSVPEEEYTVENALNLLFQYRLSEEERAQGFYNELYGFEFVSMGFEVDSDGAIADLINSTDEDFTSTYGHDHVLPETQYLAIVIRDTLKNYFTIPGIFVPETEAFKTWWQEIQANTDYEKDPICWNNTVDIQISSTIRQFLPQYYDDTLNTRTVLSDELHSFNFIDPLAFSNCGEGSSCETLPDFSVRQYTSEEHGYSVDLCHFDTVFGQNYYICKPIEEHEKYLQWVEDNELGTFMPRSVYDPDPWEENTWNLSGVCLSYPDSPVCDLPEVVSTLK